MDLGRILLAGVMLAQGLCWTWASSAAAADGLVAPRNQVGAPSAGAQRRGTLYKVSRDGRLAYLFGTVHVGKDGDEALGPEVSLALAGANTLALELDVRDQADFERALRVHGRYADGDTLDKHLSSDSLRQLTQSLHAVGISMHSMAGFKPWLVVNLLMGLQLERNGLHRSKGVEFKLLASAARHGLAIASLESAGYQLSLYDTLSDAKAERYLRENLARLNDGEALRKARADVDAWASADALATDALLAQLAQDASVAGDFMRRILLGRRNPEMAGRIDALMRANEVTFVAVGLLHLLGAAGLPQLLALRGCRVERLY